MILIPQPRPVEFSTPSASRGKLRDARLRKHADYQRVYGATRKQFSASMTWFLALRPVPDIASPPVPAGARVGLTVGKVIGKAHERNRIKRRMREVVRQHLGELPDGVDLILHPRRSVMSMDFVKLDAEVLRIFRQAAGQAAGLTRHAAQTAAGMPAPPSVQTDPREKPKGRANVTAQPFNA